MLTAILLLTALALLLWSITYERRRRARSTRPGRSRLLRRAGPFAGPLPADRDTERLLQELRALPGAPADLERHLRR